MEDHIVRLRIRPEWIELCRHTLALEGLAVVDRARVEWLLSVAELAYEWVNAPEDSSIGRQADDALTHVVDEFKPGYLDPLP